MKRVSGVRGGWMVFSLVENGSVDIFEGLLVKTKRGCVDGMLSLFNLKALYIVLYS